MKLWRRRELRDSIRPERVKAVMEFGFTEPQARFILHVLVYSGVFIERQYRAFTGVSHGQRTKDFLSTIVGRGYATVITPGKLHQGRLFHVRYKPLYEAIGEANNRNRKPASNANDTCCNTDRRPHGRRCPRWKRSRRDSSTDTSGRTVTSRAALPRRNQS